MQYIFARWCLTRRVPADWTITTEEDYFSGRTWRRRRSTLRRWTVRCRTGRRVRRRSTFRCRRPGCRWPSPSTGSATNCSWPTPWDRRSTSSSWTADSTPSSSATTSPIPPISLSIPPKDWCWFPLLYYLFFIWIFFKFFFKFLLFLKFKMINYCYLFFIFIFIYVFLFLFFFKFYYYYLFITIILFFIFYLFYFLFY